VCMAVVCRCCLILPGRGLQALATNATPCPGCPVLFTFLLTFSLFRPERDAATSRAETPARVADCRARCIPPGYLPPTPGRILSLIGVALWDLCPQINFLTIISMALHDVGSSRSFPLRYLAFCGLFLFNTALFLALFTELVGAGNRRIACQPDSQQLRPHPLYGTAFS